MISEEKYRGSIKLSAIGDALGWMTEFESSVETVKKKFGKEKITEFYSWKKATGGRFYGYVDNIKAGSYSDDTQLSLAVARSINEKGCVDNNYFSKIELVDSLYYLRGGGKTIKAAAKELKKNDINWFNNFFTYKIRSQSIDYRQSGANGAAMRILPIALVNIKDFNKLKEEIFCNSIITHGHPRALIGAMLYGYALQTIMRFCSNSFFWKDFIVQIGSDFVNKFSLSFFQKTEIKNWINNWNQGSNQSFENLYTGVLEETVNYLRIVYKCLKNDVDVRDTLNLLGCFDISTKGSGTSTVIAGIYLATKFHDKPLEAIIEAVNSIGSDTDSIAAFTGALMGALYGDSIIPNKWNLIQDREYLDKIALQLFNFANGRAKKDDFLHNLSKVDLKDIDENSFNNGMDFIVSFRPLGLGKVLCVDRQDTLIKEKYRLIFEIKFDNGQSIVVSKLLNKKK